MTRMRTEFIDLVSRVVVFHLDGLSHFMNSVSWHMDHEHQEEASTKSVRLPLGLLQCNESTIQGMMEIVRTVNRLYVPYVDGKSVVRVHFTGDQKTTERFRSTVSSVLSEETKYDRMAGLFTHCEDFHCSMSFVDLIFHMFWDSKSYSNV